uniref:Uncharacterized protein n=1 Tax=Coptotermes formosanus TaxID=36987 RepID=R4UNV3_COPFO|nr:hypothetical protein [Coptotermes formosanus]
MKTAQAPTQSAGVVQVPLKQAPAQTLGIKTVQGEPAQPGKSVLNTFSPPAPLPAAPQHTPAFEQEKQKLIQEERKKLKEELEVVKRPPKPLDLPPPSNPNEALMQALAKRVKTIIEES